MSYSDWWRWIRKRLGLIAAVALWVMFISLLLMLAGWRVALPDGRTGSAQTWAHQTLNFYEDVVPVVIREARKINAVRIQIHPATNSTDTLCSAPCNEGLAQAICQGYANADSAGAPEVVFWNQPPALRGPGEALRKCLGSIPDWSLFRGAGLYAGWFVSDSRGATEKVDVPSPGQPTLHLTIHIEKIELQHDKKIFQAQFDLFGGPSAAGQIVLAPYACQGDMAQIRWFTRTRSNHCWRYVTNAVAFTVLTSILLVLMIPWVRRKLDDYVEARISVRCTAIGAVFGLVLLVLTPVVRDRVDFYERANLFYVVDRNSEIWLPDDVSTGEKGIPYLAERLELDVNEKVVSPPAALGKSFPKWLWEEAVDKAWKPVYQPERYSLNSPFVLQVFGFSGSPEATGTDWIPLGIGGNGVVRQAIQTGALSPDETCVARQLCPQSESGLLAEVRQSTEANGQRMPPTFVLLMTSQCASSSKDHEGFLTSLPRVAWGTGAGGTDESDATRELCSNMHVFTVLVPSLPRSGGARKYDYADGKHVLASLFSEHIVPLNAPTDTTWLRDIRALEQSWSGSLPQPCRAGNTGLRRATLKSPLFDMHRLTSSHRDWWDSPRNLSRLRIMPPASSGSASAKALPAPAGNGDTGPQRDYHLLTSPQAMEVTSREVADEFRQFVKHPDRLKTRKSVHVIGQTPWPYWLLGAGVALLLGAWAFCLQYVDDAYCSALNQLGWKDIPWNQVQHRALPAMIFPLMFLFLLIVVWQSEDPQVWTSSGNPAWAFCAGVLFWAYWVVAPHVYFQTSQNPQTEAYAGRYAVVFALVFAVCVVAVNVWLPDSGALWRWCKFVVTAALVLTATVYCTRKIDVDFMGAGAHLLAWWRRPVWSGLLISVLAVLLITLLRGALLAGPVAGRGWMGWAGNLLARVDFVGFVAVTVLLVSGLGFGIAFTQRGRWSPRRAVIWLVPLLTAGFSIWLFLQ